VRIQTLYNDTNPKYDAVISKFYENSSYPLVVNISFYVQGELIICVPLDALKCFMETGLEVSAVGNCSLLKEEKDVARKGNYEERYELD